MEKKKPPKRGKKKPPQKGEKKKHLKTGGEREAQKRGGEKNPRGPKGAKGEWRLQKKSVFTPPHHNKEIYCLFSRWKLSGGSQRG